MKQPENDAPKNDTSETAREPATLTSLPEGVYCPECGYDLRGSTSPRCPECGFALESLRASESQIPWVHRRQLGLWRAYWRTAKMVTYRGRRFCTEMAHPVSHADARSFRWTTIALATASAAIVLATISIAKPALIRGYRPDTWLVIPVLAGAVLALVAITGLPSYFFHPRRLPTRLQDRAIALSYYACAPLAILPVVAILLAAFHAAIRAEVPILVQYLTPSFPAWFGVGGLAIVLLACWQNLVELAARVLQHRRSTLLIAALIPPLWVIVGGAALAAVPAITFYIALMLYTLI